MEGGSILEWPSCRLQGSLGTTVMCLYSLGITGAIFYNCVFDIVMYNCIFDIVIYNCVFDIVMCTHWQLLKAGWYYLYCRFFNGNENAFSTEPLKNDNPDLSLGFYHMQNVGIYLLCVLDVLYVL